MLWNLFLGIYLLLRIHRCSRIGCPICAVESTYSAKETTNGKEFHDRVYLFNALSQNMAMSVTTGSLQTVSVVDITPSNVVHVSIAFNEALVSSIRQPGTHLCGRLYAGLSSVPCCVPVSESANNWIVWVAYNETHNVITTAPGSVSQMRDSNFFLDMQLYLGCRSMDPIRNPTSLKEQYWEDLWSLPENRVNNWTQQKGLKRMSCLLGYL